MDTKVTNADMPEVLFFGCMARPAAAGHSLYSKRQRNISTYTGTPWGAKLDGGLLRPGGQQTGGDTTPVNRVVLAVKDGWTAVSFWDRSGDSRGASNSAFVVHATWPDAVPDSALPVSRAELVNVCGDSMIADWLLELARQQWPEIFARPGFPLSQHNGRRIHVLPIDDGHYTGTDAILHCAQLSCWCHPTPDPEAPLTIVHNAKDGREAAERNLDRMLQTYVLADGAEVKPPSPGWILVGEDF